MQKFILVGENAYRDAFDAIKAGASMESKHVELDYTNRINDIWSVSDIAHNSDRLEVVATSYHATPDDAFEAASKAKLVAIKKIPVFPFLERKPRKDQTPKQD